MCFDCGVTIILCISRPPSDPVQAAPLLWDATNTLIEASVKATTQAALQQAAAAFGYPFPSPEAAPTPPPETPTTTNVVTSPSPAVSLNDGSAVIPNGVSERPAPTGSTSSRSSRRRALRQQMFSGDPNAPSAASASSDVANFPSQFQQFLDYQERMRSSDTTQKTPGNAAASVPGTLPGSIPPRNGMAPVATSLAGATAPASFPVQESSGPLWEAIQAKFHPQQQDCCSASASSCCSAPAPATAPQGRPYLSI